ncbi:MAG: hypothetical protein ACI89Z_000899 [Porticoccus sp.]|jgi:hypothetical protein
MTMVVRLKTGFSCHERVERYIWRLTQAPAYTDKGTLVGVVQTILDNTDYKNIQSALKKLTGLHNRRFLTTIST